MGWEKHFIRSRIKANFSYRKPYVCAFPPKLKPRVVQTVNVGCKASQNVDLIAAELVGWVEKRINKLPNCSKLLLSHTIIVTKQAQVGQSMYPHTPFHSYNLRIWSWIVGCCLSTYDFSLLFGPCVYSPALRARGEQFHGLPKIIALRVCPTLRSWWQFGVVLLLFYTQLATALLMGF